MSTFFHYGSAWRFQPYSDWSVRRRAVLDARNDPAIPVWTAPAQPPFLIELKQVGDSALREINENWKQRNIVLHAAETSLLREVDERSAELGRVEQERDAALAFYSSRHEEPPAHSAFASSIGYTALLIVLGLIELPLNAVVFRLFGESEVMTLVMAGAIGLTLPLCAHLLGETLSESDYKRKTNVAMALLGVALPAAALSMVAYFRKVYIAANPDPQQKLDERAVYFGFFAFNAIFYFAATWWAYRRHKQGHAVLLASETRLRRARKRFKQAEQAWRVAVIRRRNEWARHRTRAERLRDGIERLWALYRTQNLAARPDRGAHAMEAHPACFMQPLEVTFPEDLRVLADPDPERLQPLKTAAAAEKR